MTIVGAVLHQAEEINDQIHVFNLRADQLCNALLEKKIDPKLLQAAADVLLPGLFATEPPPPPPRTREDAEDEARARLRKQFTQRKAVIVLAQVYIYGITATDQELAGGGMFTLKSLKLSSTAVSGTRMESIQAFLRLDADREQRGTPAPRWALPPIIKGELKNASRSDPVNPLSTTSPRPELASKL